MSKHAQNFKKRKHLMTSSIRPFNIHQSLLWHKLVYNGGCSNFALLLLVQNSTYVAQTLHGLSYEVWSTFITKFGTIESSVLILDISAIIYQSPCCYVVTISRIGRLKRNRCEELNIGHKVNAWSTIVKRCLNIISKLKKSIFVKNSGAHFT